MPKRIALLFAMIATQACQREQRVDVRIEPAPEPSVVASTPTASASAIAPSVPVRFKPCPETLKKDRRTLPSPPLNTDPELLPLMLAAEKGAPERVRLRFHHPIAGCECPSFSLTDYGDREEKYRDIRLSASTEVIFSEGVPGPRGLEGAKYYGRTIYELTGYFSGRIINFYGLEEPPDASRRIGGEEEANREARHPEFCVEDWCYIPDPDPGLYKSIQTPKEIAADQKKYRDSLKEMQRAGAKLCRQKK